MAEPVFEARTQVLRLVEGADRARENGDFETSRYLMSLAQVQATVYHADAVLFASGHQLPTAAVNVDRAVHEIERPVTATPAQKSAGLVGTVIVGDDMETVHSVDLEREADDNHTWCGKEHLPGVQYAAPGMVTCDVCLDAEKALHDALG